jgi:hypothetical protein
MCHEPADSTKRSNPNSMMDCKHNAVKKHDDDDGQLIVYCSQFAVSI